MIYTGLSESEIKKVTGVLELYGCPYKVRISDYMQEHNNQMKQDWVGAYHLNVASTDLLEIEFDPTFLKGKVNKEESQILLGCRIMIDQDEMISDQEYRRVVEGVNRSIQLKEGIIAGFLLLLFLLGLIYLRK